MPDTRPFARESRMQNHAHHRARYPLINGLPTVWCEANFSAPPVRAPHAIPFMRIPPTLLLCVAVITSALASISTATPPALALKAVSTGQIVSPVNICNAGDGSKRLFVADQTGSIYVINDSMVLPTKFLDISGKLVPRVPTTYPFPLAGPTGNGYDERGLLGMALIAGVKVPPLTPEIVTKSPVCRRWAAVVVIAHGLPGAMALMVEVPSGFGEGAL